MLTTQTNKEMRYKNRSVVHMLTTQIKKCAAKTENAANAHNTTKNRKALQIGTDTIRNV